MSKNSSQKVQKQAKAKSPLDEMVPDITPELIMELWKLLVEEIEKKIADKQVLLDRLKGETEERMKVLKEIADQKAQLEAKRNKNERFVDKQKSTVTEGTEVHKEAQAMYNELVDEFNSIQAKISANRAAYQQMARNFVAKSKKMYKEVDDKRKILAEKREEPEKADQKIKEMQQALAEKKARFAQKKAALLEKQSFVMGLKAKNASVDMNALTATLKKVKLANDEKSQQVQALRKEASTIAAARDEVALNRIIAEAALGELEEGIAQKGANVQDLESKLAEQKSLVQKTMTFQMRDRGEHIKLGNEKMAKQLQDGAEVIASKEAMKIELRTELESLSTEVQMAEREGAKQVDENKEIAQAIADPPKLIIDRTQETAELKQKLEAIEQESSEIREEIKENAQKMTKKIRQEKRRNLVLGFVVESSTISETEFDLNMSSSLETDILVNIPKVDLNETNDACARLEQMKRN